MTLLQSQILKKQCPMTLLQSQKKEFECFQSIDTYMWY